MTCVEALRALRCPRIFCRPCTCTRSSARRREAPHADAKLRTPTRSSARRREVPHHEATALHHEATALHHEATALHHEAKHARGEAGVVHTERCSSHAAGTEAPFGL